MAAREETGFWKRGLLALLLILLLFVHGALYLRQPKAEILWGGIGTVLIFGPLILEERIPASVRGRLKPIAAIIGLTLGIWLSAWPMANPPSRWVLVLIYIPAVLWLAIMAYRAE